MIAIGAAKCMGFKLMDNFNRPYLATSIKDFWRRWHISLSSWFTDYVYIPLGGNRCSILTHLRNLLITFLVSGIWHGADWTFIAWGALHGVFLCIQALYHKYVDWKFSNGVISFFRIVFTFCLVMFGWVFFKADSLDDAFSILHKIFTQPGMLYTGEGIPSIVLPLILIALLMVKEIKDELNLKISFMHHHNKWVSLFSTALMVIVIMLCAEFESGQFIYFQF